MQFSQAQAKALNDVLRWRRGLACQKRKLRGRVQDVFEASNRDAAMGFDEAARAEIFI